MMVKIVALSILATLLACGDGGSRSKNQSKGSSGGNGTPPVFALTEGGSVNIANQTAFAFRGTCTTEGAEITVTLGTFEPKTVSCKNFVWELPLDTSILDQIPNNVAISLTIAEAGSQNPVSIEIKKDTEPPTVGLGSFKPSVITSFNQGEYSLEGICSEEGIVSVSMGDLETQTIACQNAQDWSLELDVRALTTEQVNLVISMVDELGNPSAQGSVALTRDIEGPQVSITTTVMARAITLANQGSYNLEGSCEEGGRSVKVTIGSLAMESVTCTSDSWAIMGKDVASLDDGDVSLLVTQQDEHRNQAIVSLNVIKDITPPSLEVTSSLVINIANKESYQAIEGTCEGSEQVMLTLGSAAVEGVSCAISAWSFAIADTLAEGNHRLTITQEDEWGNTSTKTPLLVKDITAPSFTFASNLGINAANKGQFSVSGTCNEVGTITVTVATFAPVTATCNGSSWATPGVDASSLEEGSVSLSASMVDDAGNPATDILSSITKNTTTWGVAINILGVITSNNETSYIVSGTCSSHTGDVTVTVGTTSSVTATCSSGTWSTTGIDVSALAEGSVSVTALFGTNADQGSHTAITTKDTVAPSIAISSSLAGSINKENQDDYAVSGTCDENTATVSVSVGGLADRTASCDGSAWSIADYNATSATGDSVSITARIEDANGNNQNATPISVARDIVLPTVSITSSRKISKAGQIDVDLEGTCSEVDQEVGVTIGSEDEVRVSCTATGWEYNNIDLSDAAKFPEGIIAVTLTHEDLAGNLLAVNDATTQLDKDITDPILSAASHPLNPINIGNETNYTFRGGCSGSIHQITISVTGISDSYEANCGANWVLNVTNLDTLEESSSIDVTLRVEDDHGNYAEITTNFVKDTTAPTVTINTLTEVMAATDLANYPVSGTCSEDSISVTVDASSVTPTVQPTCSIAEGDSAGTWSTTLDISSFTTVISFSARQTDAAGNQGRAREKTLGLSGARLYFERQNLALGKEHSCAVTKDNKVLCWGIASSGQLGDGSSTNRDHPVYVIDGDGSTTHLTDIVEVTAGSLHTCALKSSGGVLCWGTAGSGQLGNGGTTHTNHPVSVKESESNSTSNLSGIIQITAGRLSYLRS